MAVPITAGKPYSPSAKETQITPANTIIGSEARAATPVRLSGIRNTPRSVGSLFRPSVPIARGSFCLIDAKHDKAHKVSATKYLRNAGNFFRVQRGNLRKIKEFVSYISATFVFLLSLTKSP